MRTRGSTLRLLCSAGGGSSTKEGASAAPHAPAQGVPHSAQTVSDARRTVRQSGSPLLTRESKLQLGVLFGSSVLLQLGVGAIVPCLPSFAAALGLSQAHVGILVAVPCLARACLNLPAGRLADVVGRKRPWIAGSLVDAAGCVATAFAGSLGSMAAARFVMGGGSAVAGSAAGAYEMDVIAR